MDVTGESMTNNFSSKILTCLIFLIILSGVSAAQTYRLQLEESGLDIPVLYEDQSLPDMVKTTVIDDYKLIFGHFNEYLFRPYDSGEVIIGGKKFKLSYAINYNGGYDIGPEDYDFNTIAVDPDTQDKYLFIHKNLSDAYKETLILKAENENAFIKLDEFVVFMNNLSQEEIANLDDVMFLSAEAEKYRAEFEKRTVAEFKDEVNGYGQYKYKKISLLEVKKVLEKPEELKGMLATRLAVLDKSNNDSFEDAPLFVYHDNKWKIFMVIHGT